jgi:hypothetical protein
LHKSEKILGVIFPVNQDANLQLNPVKKPLERQHAPLGTRIRDPQEGFDDASSRGRSAAGSTGRNVLLGKIVPDAFSVLLVLPWHPADNTGFCVPPDFEIGSNTWRLI